MMTTYRTLMMSLGLGGDAEPRLTGALAVARHFGAHLQVLFTYFSPRWTIPEDIFGVSRATMHELAEAADRHSEEAGASLHALFLDLCKRHRVPVVDDPGKVTRVSATWRQGDGLRSQLIASRGRLVDLIILSRPPQARPSASIEAALLETGRPLLLMPRKQLTFQAGRILVGWNGSREAARAVADAMPMLIAAKAVIVASTETRAHVEPSLEGVRTQLAAHGVAASTEVLPPGTQHIGAALVDAAHRNGADLIVIGGYSRPRMREMVFGGVTLQIVAEADFPVFMAH